MKQNVKQNRIAIIRPDGNPIPKGFYNSQEIGLAKAISKLGFDIDIFMATFDTQMQVNNITSNEGGTVTVYEMPRMMLAEIGQAIYPGLIKVLRQKQYALIQVNESNDLTSYWVSRYAKKNNIQCIIYQGMYEPLTGRILAVFHHLYRILILPFFKKNIQIAVAKTSWAENYLKEKGFKKTQVMPVGLDTEPFLKSQRRDWHAELDIPSNATILLYIGIFETRRNIHFLLDLAEKLKHNNCYLLLAGKGPLLEEITQRLKQEQIENVILLGQVAQNNIKSLYEIADFFLLASAYEIYGMVVLESMYCGCPVISTQTAGPVDMIKNGENGFIMDSLDIDIWARTILENLRTFNRDQISNYICQNLTWNIIAEKYINEFLTQKDPD